MGLRGLLVLPVSGQCGGNYRIRAATAATGGDVLAANLLVRALHFAAIFPGARRLDQPRSRRGQPWRAATAPSSGAGAGGGRRWAGGTTRAAARPAAASRPTGGAPRTGAQSPTRHS